MLTDYHVHLERGPLTREWLGLFVAAAERQAIGDLGISEHGFRFAEMLPVMHHVARGPEAWPVNVAWFEDHFQDSVHDYIALMAEATGVFGRELKTGLEVDYFSEYSEAIRQVVSGLPLDYVLGSVHFLGPWGFDVSPSIGWPTRDIDEVYPAYYSAANSMIRSGIFDIMAHPDVVKVFGHRPTHSMMPYYEEVAANLAAMGMCAEVSTAGLRKPVAEMYPSLDFLRVLRAHDVPIVISSDAHEPEHVGYRYDVALAHARACGYTHHATFRGRQYDLATLPG